MQKRVLKSVLVMFLALTALPYGFVSLASASPSEMDSEIISVSVNGVSYASGDAAVQLVTDQVFRFTIVVRNTGSATWGQFYDQGQRGATFMSRGPDYNETFGTFLLSPNQGSLVSPDATFTYDMSLRAPAAPGEYTMIWQLADWIIPYIYLPNMDYTTRPFYGEATVVKITVAPRTEQPPPAPPRVAGVLDIYDFEYEGSFSMPSVPGIPQGDYKSFFESGIALRTVNGEKRMLLTTGTYEQSVYEVAIPKLGKFVGNDSSDIPIAELRTVFGGLPKGAGATTNGTMWYDEESDLLYWTNWHDYYTAGTLSFPVLRSARLNGGVLTEAQQWFQPEDRGGAPLKSFWAGVTRLPDSFAGKYTGGRKLALGFGGNFSINASATWGPSFGAVSVDLQAGGDMDLLPVIYSSISNRAFRDGNYFYSGWSTYNPVNPWEGTWSSIDDIRSGVFIDLPDKKGYVTFTRQVIGRIGYDYGGSNWNGRYQNVWYFYDFDTLGAAATGAIGKISVMPSSISIVEFPYDVTKDDQKAAGSCFDPETRRLYLYTLNALRRSGLYSDPVVHVYKVKEDSPATHTVTFSVVGGNGGLAAALDSVNILSGALVQEGRSVIFTANPNSGYKVKEWKLNSTVIAGNTTNSYTLASLSGAAIVTVEFEVIDEGGGNGEDDRIGCNVALGFACALALLGIAFCRTKNSGT